MYRVNLNWYKFFLSNETISQFIHNLLMTIKDNNKSKFNKEERIAHFLTKHIRLKICLLEYTLNSVCEYFPSDSDYKKIFKTIYSDYVYKRKETHHKNELCKKLISQFYKPLYDPKDFFSLLTNIQLLN